MAWAVVAAMQTGTVAAQVPLDRADPTVVERALPQPVVPSDDGAVRVTIAPPAAAASAPVTGVVRAITVVGQDRLGAAVFADAIAPVIGQPLTRDDLSRLAGAVADVARRRGYPFATAAVEPQSLAGGILRVTLDLGRIDAVRVVGARNAAADRILGRALATGAPIRQGSIERALLLVGDLPGVRVVSNRFVRQDGFGILLVTIEDDRAAAFVQVDNRGSDEVGPVRSTILASVRGVAAAGDELATIVSQTPLQLSEFAFLRARYAAPVDAAGTVATLSGSVARSRPGGALAPLRVVGRSADAAVGIQHPLLRRRTRSLWAGAELRTLGSQQDVSGQRLRRDRLTTLAATLTGNAADVAGGTLRGEMVATIGLPLAGATREGSPTASRSDGDARFVTWALAADWTVALGGPFSVVVAGAGQLASRPLLAAAEIGAGGPGFGRAYDYAERTGDRGVLGSVELRADVGRIANSVVDRSQVYGFVDGGTVGNLRDGIGGGTIASTGAGARIGTGRLDWLAEIALPLNADRFDTGDRRPRISVRLSRAF
ncbi:hypothetical protein ASG29_03620 [Sphingomonas sp. Leaf412]|nr:hypothetical protein ASG29_03620 [Sphingomonas sp. Leaf412]